MARTLRIQYPGAVYPVMNRGDRREAIFRDARDYACFLQTLAAACAKACWPVPAWCLRPNHFHLVLATPQPTLVAGLKWLLERGPLKVLSYLLEIPRRQAWPGGASPKDGKMLKSLRSSCPPWF